MARKSHDDALGVAGAETVIGAGVIVKGNLNSTSDIMVDAQLEGDIITTGDVNIGTNARIIGSIRGVNVTVSGHLTGNIQAEGSTTIRETGQVLGNIKTENLALTLGAIFVGRSTMPIPPELPAVLTDSPFDQPSQIA